MSSFEAAAKRLGLSYGTSGGLLPIPVVRGELMGQEVRSTWSDRATRVEALFDPPLDLGLSVQSAGFIGTPTLGERVTVGEAAWDGEIEAKADESARALVLLTPDLRGALLRLNAFNSGVEMTDGIVAAYVAQADETALVEAFSQVARIAGLVAKARRAVWPATPLGAHAAALRAFARERGLEYQEAPLDAQGEVLGVHLIARFIRTARLEHELDVLAAPRGDTSAFGLVVRRETALDRIRTFLGGQDISTGDPEFDPAFLVRASEEERARAALDADVRALFMDLHARFASVTLDESGLSLRGAAGRVRPEDLDALLTAACTVVERVARASGAVLRGPYR